MSDSEEQLFILGTEPWTMVKPDQDELTIINGGKTRVAMPHDLHGHTECLSCRWINRMPAVEDGSLTDISESAMMTEEEAAGMNYVGTLSHFYRCEREQCRKVFTTKDEHDEHELKHLSRFFCTFDTCFKQFESKKDWESHEWRQHVQSKMWRCQFIVEKHPCAVTFKDEDAFTNHLLKEHKITEKEDIEARTRYDKIAQKWNGSYWCGFCKEIYSQQAKSPPDQYTERNNHISNHFEKANIDLDLMAQWYNIEGRSQTKKEAGKEMRKDWEGALVYLI